MTTRAQCSGWRGATSIAAFALVFAGCRSPATPAGPRPPKPSAESRTASVAEPGDGRPAKKERTRAERDAWRAAAGLEHRRSAYDTAPWNAPPPEAQAILDVLIAATRSSDAAGRSSPTVVLDEGLSRVAAKVAADPATSTLVDPLLYQRTHEAGSPLELRWVVRITAEQATLEWARRAATAMQSAGTGTLVIGVGIDPRHPDERVVVWARKGLDLVGKVPRRQAREIRVVLDPAVRTWTPRLLLVGPAGIERIDGTRSGEVWSFQRPLSFDGTLAAVVGYGKPSDRFMDPYRTVARSPIGVMHFANPPVLPGDDAASLESSIASLRQAWHRAPLRVDVAFVPPCGEKVGSISGVRVMQDQQCISWRSGGSDAQRWAALRFHPSVFDLIDDDAYQLLQIRRDSESTTLRFGSAFEDLNVEQARARVEAELTRRFPGAKHDTAADALPRALARRWAAKQDPRTTANAFGADADAEAVKWAKGDASGSWLRAGESVDALLAGFDPREAPTRYAVGVARSAGAADEMPYYVTVYYSSAAKP